MRAVELEAAATFVRVLDGQIDTFEEEMSMPIEDLELSLTVDGRVFTFTRTDSIFSLDEVVEVE